MAMQVTENSLLEWFLMKACNVFAVSLHHLERKKTQYVALNYLLYFPTAFNKGICNRMYLPHLSFQNFILTFLWQIENVNGPICKNNT